MDGRGKILFFPIVLLLLFSSSTHLSKAADSISATKPLSANQTIVSEGGTFELGFFTPGNSQNYYIGIWYKQIPVREAVWVANRDNPISNITSAELKISKDGNLVLTQFSIQIWSANLTSPTSNSPIAVLLETGNLVLREALNSSIILWQSFDHPTNTWLPTQKLGLNRITGEDQLLISWTNLDDPSTGLFAQGIDPNDTDQYFLWRNGTKYWTTGLWNGAIFSNIANMRAGGIASFVHFKNESENYFTYTFRDNSTIARFVMDVTGQAKVFKWLESTQEWLWVCLLPSDPCSVPHLCGSFGSCSSEAVSFCDCLEGFEPKFAEDWNLSDWSGGCRRKTDLQCSNINHISGEKDGFLKISNLQLPSNPQSLKVDSAEECESSCLSNCSCSAYSYVGECLMWFDELYDLKSLSNDSSNGESSGVLYLRVAASELPSDDTWKRRVSWVIVGVVAGLAVCLAILIGVIWRYRTSRLTVAAEGIEGSLVLFKYKDLLTATNNFSNKLGAGGFGAVFKGTMPPDSTPIAVKKLARMGQGEKQFRAEVSTVGMIRHVNLVTLRGFCSEGSERLLVYDYMPKGSLDSVLFRNNSSKVLDWATRYSIALGIAKGLAYLHDSCRDCIIHCDVKPENILLDAEYSPKVADFGMAKLVGREFSRVLTTVRGTIGYLAPEWLSGLAITPKADVYSYGMLLLEIIAGRRNMVESEDGEISFLPIWAANKIIEDDVLSLLDNRLGGEADIIGLRRACRVGLWCIQAEESHRPKMSLVIQILEGVLEVNMPPIPKQFYGIETCRS